MNIKSVKGMNDIFAPVVNAWSRVEDTIKKHFRTYGYSEIRTPIVEYTSLFTRSVGEATDIVQKEMYTFLDKNQESLTLRPEGTAPVVRAVLEQNLLNSDPTQKLFYLAPMFRYERPQKGRYRQFHQYGVEVFGVQSAYMDADIIAMLRALYERLGLTNLETRICSLGCDNCRPQFRESVVKALSSKKGELCPDCQNRIEKNPLRVFDCKNESCRKISKNLPSPLDFLCSECQNHFDALRDNLVRLKTPFVVEKHLVRGLDYYNRTVFEFTTTQLGAQDAVGGGGRYDKLVGQLGGPSTPAVGYAGGTERLMLLLEEKFLATENLSVFIVAPDEAGLKEGFRMAFALRNQGVSVELDYSGKSMKAQMKRADKLQARFVIIIGQSELDRGIGVIRNMQTKDQKEVKLTDLEKEIIGSLN